MNTALSDLFKMARLAQMQRELVESNECDGQAFKDSAQGKRIVSMQSDIQKLERKLMLLEQAVTFDPENPPAE
jgi:hypothetical protein